MKSWFQNVLGNRIQIIGEDKTRCTFICNSVKGYSEINHYGVFKHVLSQTNIKTALIVGVYFGRDISFMLDIANRLQRELQIIGVDKFSDTACADWPVDKINLTWDQAGFGQAPTIEAASTNISKFGQAKLVADNDIRFLDRCTETFDLIYLDTSHDYETVKAQIQRCKRLLNPGGLLLGDDYSDEGTWGVKRAVSELLPSHELLGGWIWIAHIGAFKPQSIADRLKRWISKKLTTYPATRPALVLSK